MNGPARPVDEEPTPEGGRLPRLLVLTDRERAARAGRSLPEVVGALGGLDLAVVFREKDLARPERLRLGREVAASARSAGLSLLVASDLSHELGADGVHLAARDPAPRDPAGWVGRSCHDETQLRAAAASGARYATVSPVFATDSKPGYGPALGEEGLAALAAAVLSFPIYALGGVEPGRVGTCRRAGAFGVAVMGAVMGAADPRSVVDLLVHELAEGRAVR